MVQSKLKIFLLFIFILYYKQLCWFKQKIHKYSRSLFMIFICPLCEIRAFNRHLQIPDYLYQHNFTDTSVHLLTGLDSKMSHLIQLDKSTNCAVFVLSAALIVMPVLYFNCCVKKSLLSVLYLQTPNRSWKYGTFFRAQSLNDIFIWAIKWKLSWNWKEVFFVNTFYKCILTSQHPENILES